MVITVGFFSFYMCRLLLNFTVSLLVVAKMKSQENAKFHFFVQILQNKQYYAQVLPKRFHLNGHTIGFRIQTQKLELHCMSP